MCLQCVVNAKVVKSNVLPGYILMISRIGDERWAKGAYGLVRSNDPDFIISNLISDPVKEMSDEEIDALPEGDERWQKYLRHASLCRDLHVEFKCDPMKGYLLVDACVKAGYKPEEHGSNVIMWLVDHIARQVGK